MSKEKEKRREEPKSKAGGLTVGLSAGKKTVHRILHARKERRKTTELRMGSK